MQAYKSFPIFAAALALAGCANNPLGSLASGGGEPATARSGGAPGTPTPPPVAMAGRWILQSPGRGQCKMTFGGAGDASEGTIAPEGGCPGKFFTSRKWDFEQAGLVLRDHNGKPLGELKIAAGSQFSGQSTAGDQITLSR